ncbi:hypothetical protein FHS29_001699 [Saccharothrix tamanrassetensis]|uniref:Uncharacterized protein n=1 Tax=Saccharothrix tamanrassetensis TaxID=1051531 RepID=A0A841CCK9_9PSEU|nr:hypothetical protein [Saccharothrix tamanrassetensis]MBB5955129.1 hypothetical protein [Saccharothrix tamanrassetensis]
MSRVLGRLLDRHAFGAELRLPETRTSGSGVVLLRYAADDAR